MKNSNTTIETIKAITFAGNHWQDHASFDLIGAFVENLDNSLADRAEALRIMGDVGMGLDRDEGLTDEEVVKAYMDACE